MTDYDPYVGRPLGAITAVLVRGDTPSVEERLQRLGAETANVSAKQPGWWRPQLVEFPGALKVGRVRFVQNPNPVTGGLNDSIECWHVADLPLAEHKSRVLLISAGEEGRDLLTEVYLRTVGASMRNIEHVRIDNDVMKKVLQKGVPEVLTGVESTEENLDTAYHGETEIRSLKKHDVRNDSKFNKVLEQPWTRMKFIPKLDRFKCEGFPPAIELRAGNTFRMWRRWDDDESIHFALQFVEFLLSLSTEKLDSTVLARASLPPHRQRSLSDFE